MPKKGSQLKILIIGGGMSGLTLANLLEQQGMQFDIIERMEDWTHAGYSLGLWPLGSRILKGLGLFEEFRKITTPLEEYYVFNKKGKKISYVNVREVLEDENMIRMITRKELLNLFLNNLNTKVQMGTTAKSIEQNDKKVKVTFSNGEKKEYDLVVGADGIHSQTREFLFGKKEMKSTKWGGWVWWVDPKLMPQNTAKEYWAGGKFMGLYPAKGSLMVIVGMPTKDMEGDKKKPSADFLKKKFSDLGPEAPKIFSKLNNKEKFFYWGFEDLRQTEWYKGRVVLMGDASNAILPTAGVGTTCAMESAAVLADELRRVDANSVEKALELYFKRRFSRVDKMQKESRFVAKLIFVRNKPLAALRNWSMKFYPAKSIFNSLLKLVKKPM